MRRMRDRPGLLAFVSAAAAAVCLGVWTGVGDPPTGALGVGIALVVGLLVIAERRHS
ncbi:MAG: hypothetical protein V7607_2569 [Solirubrobacteraceae bacterium]